MSAEELSTDTHARPRPPPRPTQPTQQHLARRHVLLGVLLTSLSGGSILAHTFGPVKMAWTVPFVVLPGSLALVLAALALRGQTGWARAFGDRLLIGGIAGLAATLVYDTVRWVPVWLDLVAFNPYAAHPIFGALITGLAPTAGLAILVGWSYHFWNGVGFGMMYGLMRPQGGWATGLAWGLGLEALMIATYPYFLDVRISNPGFWVTSIVGHACWGLTLGAGVSWWTARSNDRSPGTGVQA